MKYDTKKICEINSLFDWLDEYGIERDEKGFAKCPFHNEKTASFKVYKDGTYHCFGCGAHGDVITFVMSIRNLSFKEACKMLDRDITVTEQQDIKHKKEQAEIQKSNRINSAVAYWEAFDDWENNEGIINLFRPSGPDAKPNIMFLIALNRRGRLEHRLNIAEIYKSSTKKPIK